MKKLFEKIKALFSRKTVVKEQPETVEEVVAPEEEICVCVEKTPPCTEESENDVVYCDNDVVIDDYIALDSFTDTDKEEVLTALRPVVKGLNSNDRYKNICADLGVTKVLKTYSNLSPDCMTLFVNLVSNKGFAETLLASTFTSEIVLPEFIAVLPAEKYIVSTIEDGSIAINKKAANN